MNLNLYAVLDDKAQAFGGMFFMAQHGQAIRDFADACSDPKSRIHRHAEDYSLFFLGVLDLESGAFRADSLPQFLARGSEFNQQLPIGQEVPNAKS